MVKRQKEKQYQSAREHRANSQLRSGNVGGGSSSSAVRKLPFHCCALSLVPFTTPVCTENGIVFEKTSIEPFLIEHKTDPVTGKPMTMKDIIKLTIDKDEEGRWQCPIMTKPFADHTKIVAIRQNPPGNEANVYSWEAYQELNVKAKNYEDLISGQKFKKTDVIILNSDDPDFQKLRDINTFYHIRNQRLQSSSSSSSKAAAAGAGNIRHSVTASRILDKLNKTSSSAGGGGTDDNKKRASATKTTGDFQKEGKRLKIFAEDVTGVALTSGRGSGSLTSTVMTVTYDNEAREATDEEVRNSMFQVMKQRKKKGYVKLVTNLGIEMLLEIHCDLVPRTSTNFIKLCQQKKYNGSSFHRLIPNFMLQGGKPPKNNNRDAATAGSGTTDDDDNNNNTDECIWGGAFRDEFHPKLNHDGPGILSMANAGPHTNRRQFFITFNKCEHLNKKHSVFGVVVEGVQLLKELEKIPTDKKDRPMRPVKILDTIIIENPVQEAEEAEMKRLQGRAEARKSGNGALFGGGGGGGGNIKEKKKKHSKEELSAGTATAAAKQSSPPVKSQIGRYLPKAASTLVPAHTTKDETEQEQLTLPPPKPNPKPGVGKKTKMKFGNFSGW